MTDKVQKIKEWISKEQDGLMDANGNFDYPEHEGAYNTLCNLDAYIDSMQEEPVSEELEEAAKHYLYSNILYDDVYVGNPTDKDCIEMFEAGAKWQKEQMMAKSIEAVVSQVPCSNEIILYNPSSVDKYYLPQEMNKLGLNKGDKVKLIIIKED
jgi:hypothetical protein